MNEKSPDPTDAPPKPSLAQLLARSLDDDHVHDRTHDRDRERWDEDEGSFGG